MPQYVNLDSGESIFFTRELETIRARTYDVQFEEPKLFNIIPKSMEGDPLATDITHRSYTRVGMAKMGGTEYATDFPRVDVYGTETTVKVKPVHSGYGYNKDEIARAAKVGRPLEAMRASAARKAIEMKLDEIARSGETSTG
ncbi:major capsid family protein, partial [Escherichia coli]